MKTELKKFFVCAGIGGAGALFMNTNLYDKISKEVLFYILLMVIIVFIANIIWPDEDKTDEKKTYKKRPTTKNYSTYTGVSQKQSGESLEMHHLLHMLLHDRKAAERLIAYEKELDPSLNREECIREAIARIRRDQRG